MTPEPSERRVYPRTGDNVPSRHPERARYDTETIESILDGGLVGHLGFVVDGRPRVLPMLYVRSGDRLYLHGSTGARFNRMAARRKGGLEVCFEVTLFDAFVLARSTFNHSVNYRSVVVAGRAEVVSDPARKKELLEALVEKLVPGRSTDARGPSEMELRQTGVLQLPLEDVSAKLREGDPSDEPEDLTLPCWAGLLPLECRFGSPLSSSDLSSEIELPGYLARLGGSPAVH